MTAFLIAWLGGTLCMLGGALLVHEKIAQDLSLMQWWVRWSLALGLGVGGSLLIEHHALLEWCKL